MATSNPATIDCFRKRATNTASASKDTRAFTGGASFRLTHVAAAAATALSTGTRVGHRQLAVDAAGKPVASLLELAHQQGRAVGLITMDTPLAPAPAAFYAHVSDARDHGQVLQQFLEHGNLDVLMCGGAGESTGQRRRSLPHTTPCATRSAICCLE